jgi:hypothetical protein
MKKRKGNPFLQMLLASIAVVAVMTGVGIFCASQSMGGKVYVSQRYMDSRRNPAAAVDKYYDYSELDGSALKLASQRRLVSAAQAVNDHNTRNVGVQLGNFVTRSENGSGVLVCPYFYDRVVLTFVAEGIAENGETPSMEIDGVCEQAENDVNLIAPIWIPVADLLEMNPSDKEFTLPDANGSSVNFKFENMSMVWPRMWALQSLRLYNSHNADVQLTVSQQEINQLSSHPLVITW